MLGLGTQHLKEKRKEKIHSTTQVTAAAAAAAASDYPTLPLHRTPPKLAEEDCLEDGNDGPELAAATSGDPATPPLRPTPPKVAAEDYLEDGDDGSEFTRSRAVKTVKNFICLEMVEGRRITNILGGLELHVGVFSTAEQKRVVDFVYRLQEMGRNRHFRESTYLEPRKWMQGKGRVTIQFGCCYNYAVDRYGNPPGILQNVVSDPIPRLFKMIIRRLIRWHVLPTSCIPDSCIVNIYEPGDCIPPHIDSHDFVRPFSTVSFLSECNILFGSDLKVLGAGKFSGSFAIPLPVGSVLVLNGNGADVAKHCVPAVPSKRISITFRKMDELKRPLGFNLDPDIHNIQPLPIEIKDHEGERKNFETGRR